MTASPATTLLRRPPPHHSRPPAGSPCPRRAATTDRVRPPIPARAPATRPAPAPQSPRRWYRRRPGSPQPFTARQTPPFARHTATSHKLYIDHDPTASFGLLGLLGLLSLLGLAGQHCI